MVNLHVDLEFLDRLTLYHFKEGFRLFRIHGCLQCVKFTKLIDIGFRDFRLHKATQYRFINSDGGGKTVDLVIFGAGHILCNIIPERFSFVNYHITVLDIVEEDLLPTIHEGATVRAMEKKGIRTEKGEFNRWIKATNAVIRDIKKKIALLFDWIAEAKVELAKPQAPDLVSLLNAYYTQRRAGAYSQKGKVSNLKEMNETFNYLRANGIYSLEDLESRVSEHSAATESLKKTLDEQTARMKAIKQLYDSSAAFQSLKPVYDGLQKIKFEKPRAKYKAEHEAELKQFYAARRKLTGEFPDGKVDMKKLTEEYDELEQAHNTTYGEFKTVRDDLHRLWKVKSCVDTAARFNERTEEQMLQNRPQTRHKKEDMTR